MTKGNILLAILYTNRIISICTLQGEEEDQNYDRETVLRAISKGRNVNSREWEGMAEDRDRWR